MEENKEKKLLVPAEEYLKAGVHIGTRFKTKYMEKFIYKKRQDRLKVMSMEELDKRIRLAANLLSNYELGKIAFVSRKVYAKKALLMMEKLLGVKVFTDRFIPGTFTNPESKQFFEPDIVFVVDPIVDNQAIEEATKIRVPVIAICSTNNDVSNIDLVLPGNNKGKKSIALILYLIARELAIKKGLYSSYSAFPAKRQDFEYFEKKGKNV